MNTSRVLFTVFVYFVFCCPAWSSPVQQITAQDVEQKVKEVGPAKYKRYLVESLAAASSGKNYLERPESLSEDCIRIARVAMELLTAPSTFLKTMRWMHPYNFEEIFNNITNKNPTELYCQILDDTAYIHYPLSDFEQWKRFVDLPHPTKNYVKHIPQNINVTQFMNDPELLIIDDEKLLRLALLESFYSQPEKDVFFVLAASNPNADDLFVRICDDYIKEIFNREVPVHYSDEYVFEDFYKKVDKSFFNDSTLGGEYQRLLDRYMNFRPPFTRGD